MTGTTKEDSKEECYNLQCRLFTRVPFVGLVHFEDWAKRAVKLRTLPVSGTTVGHLLIRNPFENKDPPPPPSFSRTTVEHRGLQN